MIKEFLKKQIVKALKETADKIEAGNCELSESEAMRMWEGFRKLL
jgi:hypothetical protein